MRKLTRKIKSTVGGAVKPLVKRVMPEPLYAPSTYSSEPIDLVKRILFPPSMSQLSYFQRVRFVHRLERISANVECAHSQDQVLPFISSFLSIPSTKEGGIVEAGCFKGGSTAKFSIGAKLANRRLVVFDSFQGLPENEEPHGKDMEGHSLRGSFKGGNYCGTLDKVRSNVQKYGEIGVCTFVEGWFEDTMPGFSQKICAAYLDVDLASSTMTCLKYLYPLLVPGGVIYSHDGDVPLVVEIYSSDAFWEKQIGCPKPHIEGLGKKKIIKIVRSC